MIGSQDGSTAIFAEIDVPLWAWLALLSFIAALIAFDVLFVHRRPHEIHTKEAAIESAVWISIGLAFGGVVALAFGASAAGEYISGFLIETSMSVDNIFVWALILSHFKIPDKYQHHVLFWGVFAALFLRAAFIFAGIALIERFAWVLYLFGVFLIFTAGKLVFGDDEEMDPESSRIMRIIGRIVPTSPDFDGQRMFTKVDGRPKATPLFAVLLLVEFTDILFAVDSVPAVLAVSREQFIVFSSNAFAILGLRALYFLLADAHARFGYLKQGLAIVLAFVGIKMILHDVYHIPTWLSLVFICIVLIASVSFSLRTDRTSRER